MTSKTLETTLTDEQIIEIAQTIDKCFLEIGLKHQPAAIELASIALGRLMVLCQQLECYDTFHELIATVAQMGSGDFTKTGDLNDSEVQNGTGDNEQGSVSSVQ